MRQLKITQQITQRDGEALDRYLNDIAREELLTPEEEVRLAARIRQGDMNALDKLVRANLRFVVSVAKQYQGQGLSLSDLINEGNIGLIKAAKRFDETKGFKFISYAVWWIRQTILQALAEHSRIVRLPVNKSNKANKIGQIFSDLSQKYNREPTPEEIAKVMQIDEKEITKLMRSDNVESLDAPIYSDDEQTRLLDRIAANNEAEAEYLAETKEMVKRLLSILPDKRSIEILKMYYGIDYIHKYTLDEIGEHLGLTRERVRQIKDKALHYLKKKGKKILYE